MAESLAIVFSKATKSEIEDELSRISEIMNDDIWRYPKYDQNYSITLYECNSWLDECAKLPRLQHPGLSFRPVVLLQDDIHPKILL